MLTKPVAFMSYAHLDDTYHGGAISTLCEELSAAVEVATGEKFPIFQDRKDTAWGQHWPSTLEQGLVGSRFLIAIVSPSFFKSRYCQEELTRFLQIERAAGRNDLILPIYFVTTPLLEDPATQDTNPLVKAISERQYRDWRDLRHLPFSDYKVRRKLDSLAEELRQALERSEPAPTAPVVEDRPFKSPFLPPVDTYDTGASEDPRKFIKQPRQGHAKDSTPCKPKTPQRLRDPGTIFRDINAPWCPKMVVIPSGSFIMGSPSEEEGHEDSEKPEHRVCIDKPFALGLYPVTFGEFDEFCRETGREMPDDMGWGRGAMPAINVNVEDAEAYLAWLSEATGKRYGLPSEAIWEFACRAGTRTPFSTGKTITTDQANFDGRMPYSGCEIGVNRDRPIAVGSFSANAFGVFDMHGNVWEWCADHWHRNYVGAPSRGEPWLDGGLSKSRVQRGGTWYFGGDELRSAKRHYETFSKRSPYAGFRCARLQE